ncbi:hypothetical protein HID58_043426 [Brassica napus]|uniref:Uncharacterized protein n=1 Tax=Brassica napus TaxID=3708 RepID=A0ABQ8BHX0_BRANA|nr:hypothetical protein HID58_043426 [Brassica napus]
MVNQTSVTIAQAPSPLFFTQVSAGPGDSKLQFRLIHFWEARKHAKGGILIGIEMLMIDEQRGSIYTLTNFFASNNKMMYGVADQKLVICITHTSIMSKLEENIEGIPSQCFRIHSFADFEANCDLRGDLHGKLCLSPMSSSRVFLGHDVDPTKDFLNWLTANPAAVSLVNPVEVVNVETLTIREIAAFIKRQPAKCTFIILGDVGQEMTGRKATELIDSYAEENGGDGAELEVPLPQCFIGTIGQTNKFRIKVAHFNFTSNRLSLIVTKIVSPAVLPPKDRPLDMPHMPISLSQNNHTASEVDSSMVIESSGGGFSYANSHPSSATDEEKKPKRIRRNG